MYVVFLSPNVYTMLLDLFLLDLSLLDVSLKKLENVSVWVLSPPNLC